MWVETQAAYVEQFPLSDRAQSISWEVRRLVEAAEPFSEALLHFRDWPLYHPDEMAVVTTLRAAHGEPRWLIESPGHLFDSSGRDLLIGLFALAVCYQWDAYLYFDHGATFLCWEGELLDFWTSDFKQLEAMRKIFKPEVCLASP